VKNNIKICLYCARFESESFKVAPLGIGYLASYLITNNIVFENDIRIVDRLEEAIQFKPDILGIGSVSQVISDAKRFASKCKESLDCITVLGGYHITCTPYSLAEEFDIGVLGEGEETFKELVLSLKESPFNKQMFKTIRGICYHDNFKITIGPDRSLIQDIDSIPWPYRHRQYSSDEPIFTSRGCPYRCTYCASHTFWGNTTRFRSADSVVSEISDLVERYQPKEIAILDDLWMADKKRFRLIVSKLIATGIPPKVSFRGFCRSNLIDEEMILLLKRINYRVVRFGAETGSDRLLKKIKGKGISISDHQRVIDLCAKHRIKCSGSFIFGIPGETFEDIELTKDFLRKNNKKFRIAGFYFFNPMPGTPIWDELLEKGKLSEDLDFERFQLDFLNPYFSWDNILYFNDENIPLDKFRQIIKNFKSEFIPFSQRWNLLNRVLQNIKLKLNL